MTLAGSITNSGETLYCYKLSNASGGVQTVTVTTGSSSAPVANSISFTGVTTVGTPTTSTQSTTAYSQSATCTTGQMIVQSFADVGSPQITSTSGGTRQFLGNFEAIANDGALTISTATASTTFTATRSGAGRGESMYLVLS
jgi:hypothetical protein